jgi:tetratricopeptide (TPR) repeat protein
MYLRGSKWSMTHRRPRVNVFRIGVLLALIGAAVYVNQVIVPQTPPLFIPTATPTRDPASYVSDAQSQFEAGKINQAIESYKQAIKASSTDPSNYLALARLQIYNSDYKSALENAQNAMLLDPNNSNAAALVGWADYFMGDYLNAGANLKTAIDQDPNNALAHAFYAELLGKQAMDNSTSFDDASAESRKALDLGPNLVETHWVRGYILNWTSNYQDAVDEFKKAIEINKNIADLHLQLGVNYLNLNDIESATAEYNKAIPLNPTDPLPKEYLAAAYAKAGNFPYAIQNAEQAMKDDPTNAVLYGNLGLYYRKNNQLDKALPNLEMAVKGGTSADGKAVKGLPLSYDQVVLRTWANYGIVLAQLNQCDQAKQVSQAMVQGVPNDEDAMYNAQYMIDTCQQNITGTWTPTAPAGTPTP